MVQMVEVTNFKVISLHVMMGQLFQPALYSHSSIPAPRSLPSDQKEAVPDLGRRADRPGSAAGFLGDGVHQCAQLHLICRLTPTPKHASSNAAFLFACFSPPALPNARVLTFFFHLFLVLVSGRLRELFVALLCSLTGVCAGVRPSKYGAMSRMRLSLARQGWRCAIILGSWGKMVERLLLFREWMR